MKKKNRRLVERAWLRYSEAAIAPGAPPWVTKTLRRTFYAGAKFLMDAVMNNLSDTGDPDEVTPEDERIMRGIDEESDEFLEEMKAGTA